MLVTHQERPRELKWYHAGPMLYGDWGTSRFYVLGLAFYYALHASFFYVMGVCILVAAVGWAYTIICRCYPDGGGVYSAAKHTSRTLAVIGALLLFADYIVTASLSALDGMHYFGVPDQFVAACAIGAILLVGIINFIGPRKAGTFALVVALATLVLTLVLLVFSIPHLRTGWAAIHRPTGSAGHQWLMLVNVVLALSGVEAIANMTGIMVPPVAKTSKKAIWPVLLEVVIFNLIFAVAMNALPSLPGVDIAKDGYATPALKDEAIKAEVARLERIDPEWQRNPELKAKVDALPRLTADEDDAKNAVLRFMGLKFVGKWFAMLAGGVFGLLLLSAVNTAVADMISIQYVMSRDRELPHFFVRLNLFGVPWLALVPAVVLPVVILCLVSNLERLADLYAIGVVGAIAINLGSCTANLTMPLKKYERVGMGILAVVMLAIELTLAYQKPHALAFAASVLVGGLLMRFATKTYPLLSEFGKAAALAAGAAGMLAATGLVASFREEISATLANLLPLIHTKAGALVFIVAVAAGFLFASGSFMSNALRYFRRAQARARAGAPAAAVAATAGGALPLGVPAGELDMDRPHVMVATRGGRPLLEFAASYAKDVRGILFVVFVRQLNVAFAGPVKGPTLDEDAEARGVLAMTAEIARREGVPMVPIYVVSPDVAYSILDFAATYNVKALLMGVSRKGTLLRALQGDVLTSVADNLPSNIPMLIHA